MATLQNLRRSITELPEAEGLALIMTVRANRRRVREEKAIAFATATESRKKKKKVETATNIAMSLDSMDSSTLNNVLELLQSLQTAIGEINGTSDANLPAEGNTNQ